QEVGLACATGLVPDRRGLAGYPLTDRCQFDILRCGPRSAWGIACNSIKRRSSRPPLFTQAFGHVGKHIELGHEHQPTFAPSPSALLKAGVDRHRRTSSLPW